MSADLPAKKGNAMTQINITRRRALALLSAVAMAATGCGSSTKTATDKAATTAGAGTTAAGGATTAKAAAPAAGKPVTIKWWHIQNADPMMGLWAGMAKDYEAAHPNVKIEITVMENEAFKSALQTNLQAGTVPDLFQSWGGGGLREQVKAGFVKDVTADTAGFIKDLNPAASGLYNVEGKQYGVPFNLGMVGFWYNKEMFTKAGITAPPATWDDYLADVKKLQAAGIVPIAVGAGDKWPAHFYYSYLLVRFGGKAAMEQAAKDGNFNIPPFIKAGEELKKLIDLKPFQPGFLSTPFDGPDGEVGAMAAGKAAMELMGQWAPGAIKNSSPDKKGMGDNLGWFPFPSVTGGAGAPTDAFGGGDGFAVGKNAPAEAIDFLKFISSIDNAKKIGNAASFLPVVKGSEVSVVDTNQKAVLDGLNKSGFLQLFLDQYYSPAVGAVVNDSVQTLFAGTATPDQVATAITASFKAK
jgi:raffinose/stachyose/melibiose transport system substrate-binding protein